MWHQARIVEQILAAYPDEVRFVFRDFPVINPPYDRMAAAMAQCALDQSQEGFWAFHDALYTIATPGSAQDDLIRLGEQVGLNGETLRACAEANTHHATVQYDEARARRLGLPGTPSFLVNDIRLFNATPDTLRAAVEQALASLS
jgi:protein-disulfide isomerase